MDIVYVILFLIIIASIVFYKRNKKTESINSLQKLNEYFKNEDFSNIDDINKLKELLQINKTKNYDKAIEIILNDAKHKFDILLEYRIQHKQPFNNLTFLKIVSNCVIDYSIRKDSNINDSIRLLFITLESEKISEIIQEERNDENKFEDFISLIDGFISRYTQKTNS